MSHVPSTKGALRASTMTAASLDGLRRAGWAKWYQACEQIQVLERVNRAWLARCAEMAVRITYHPELRSDDPLNEMAQRIIGALRLRPYGQVALKDAIAKIQAERTDATQEVAV